MNISQYALPIAIGLAILFAVILILMGYVKAPPNKAFIISGWRKKSRTLIGQAGIRIPFIERKDELTLESISVDVKTKNSVPTTDFININVDAVANIQVDYDSKSTTEGGLSGLERASKNFLNRNSQYIADFVRETLEGNLREVIGKISLKDLVQNRQGVVTQVTENVIPDLKNMGIRLVSFNIQNFSDENGIIEDLGIENTAKIKKDAAIAKAEADKQVAIAKAEADKQANDARILSSMEIERKNQELEVRKAELKAEADVKVAQADAAYKIQEQEERKKVVISTQNAKIAEAEREKDLQAQQVLVKEQELESSVKKQAEAQKYAEMQEADADLYRRKQDAAAKRIEEEERAKGIEAVGKAEADAIKLKGLAEAEAMEKKAEAMKKYGQAAITEMIVTALPKMAEAIAEPIAAIDKVSIIGGDSNGVSGMADNVPTILAKTIESVKEATGFDLTEVMKADTIEGKTTHNVNLTGAEKLSGKVQEVDETLKDNVPSKDSSITNVDSLDNLEENDFED
ncbi:flotillin [Lachnospiraceae bacterium PF1-22]